MTATGSKGKADAERVHSPLHLSDVPTPRHVSLPMFDAREHEHLRGPTKAAEAGRNP
jgi:hypothetical protein